MSAARSTSAAPLLCATASTLGTGSTFGALGEDVNSGRSELLSFRALEMSRAAVRVLPVPGGPLIRESRRPSAHAIASSCDGLGTNAPRLFAKLMALTIESPSCSRSFMGDSGRSPSCSRSFMGDSGSCSRSFMGDSGRSGGGEPWPTAPPD